MPHHRRPAARPRPANPSPTTPRTAPRPAADAAAGRLPAPNTPRLLYAPPVRPDRLTQKRERALIRPGQPFTVALLSVRVGAHLESRLRGHNDLLLLSRVAEGHVGPVTRLHAFAPETPAGTPLQNLLADTLHAMQAGSGGRLWIELHLREIDRHFPGLRGESHRAARETLEKLAASAGALFPTLLPYLATTRGALDLARHLLDLLARDTTVLKFPIALHPVPEGERPGEHRPPLRIGTYTVRGPHDSVVTFDVRRGHHASPDHEHQASAARLLDGLHHRHPDALPNLLAALRS